MREYTILRDYIIMVGAHLLFYNNYIHLYYILYAYIPDTYVYNVYMYIIYRYSWGAGGRLHPTDAAEAIDIEFLGIIICIY